jgi:hypothetical protein
MLLLNMLSLAQHGISGTLIIDPDLRLEDRAEE